jgi:hypothetical protein
MYQLSSALDTPNKMAKQTPVRRRTKPDRRAAIEIGAVAKFSQSEFQSPVDRAIIMKRQTKKIE